MKRVLDIDGGDGNTTLLMYLIPLNAHLKMVKMVHFILCVSNYNKKFGRKNKKGNVPPEE